MDPLKLIALDSDDLAVISTHLQDATLKVGDVLWRPAEHRVVVAVKRFDWEAASSETPSYARRLAALRFDRVLSCKCRDLDCGNKDQILNLLAIEFSPTDEPAGVVKLFFSGGGALRLEVECLEAEVVDLGPSWACNRCPTHALDELPEVVTEMRRA
jgi:hypothetical protein